MTHLELGHALSGEAIRMGERLREAGGRPVLVGGWVRDFLLGRPNVSDYDLEVFGLQPTEIKKVLQKFGPVHAVGRQFGVLKVTTSEAEYDVSVPRRESKTGKGHKGFWVDADPGMSYQEAASRRDFTINSMGYAFLEQTLLDPFEGERDLKSRLLRHVGPAFGEDPLRVLRAMQLAGRLGLEIAPETLAICREQELAELPRERLWEEFRKLQLRAEAPSRGLIWAGPLGILDYFPELAALVAAPALGGATPWARTLAVVDHAAQLRTGEPSNDAVLMFAALCHEMALSAPGQGTPETRGAALLPPAQSFLARLTNEKKITDGVLTLLREMFQPEAIFTRREEKHTADAEIRRLSTRVRITELERLARARWRGMRPQDGQDETTFPAGDWLLEKAGELGVERGPPAPILKGQHLKELGLTEGLALGRIVKAGYELQLDGGFADLQGALDWARQALAAEKMPPSGDPRGKA